MSRFAAELHEERSLGRAGYRIAMRGLLALIAVEVARMAASRARADPLTPTDATVVALRKLIEEHFQTERQLAFYADKLAMTVDRLNDHVKRATGVTAGHLIRQRVLTEAKRQLVFTNQPIHEIAYDLAFSDPSHFARFFRKQTGTAPHEFREARGRVSLGFASVEQPETVCNVQARCRLSASRDKVNKGFPLGDNCNGVGRTCRPTMSHRGSGTGRHREARDAVSGFGSVNLALLSIYFFPVWGRDAVRALISPYNGLEDRVHAAAAIYFRQLFDLGLNGLVHDLARRSPASSW